MGRDRKDKKDKSADIVNIKPMNPKTGLIDAASIREYKSAHSQYKVQNGKEANYKLEEHIQTRIHKTVEEQKKKRKRDISSVAASTAAGTLVPFSGIPIMVATTMVQCVGFSAALGLIPIANVRSFQDANTLASQLTSTLTKASTSGVKAAIEAFILEALKAAGLGYWLWDEILKDIVFEITSGVVTEAAWFITPLFAAPKYILHRKLIKKMYAAVGAKAIVVHKAWVNDHLFLGKPETEKTSEENVAAAAAAAVAAAHPGFPSAYPAGYAQNTGQRLYESNSDQVPAPYPVYYQPAFASSAHGEAHPHEAAPAHSNSFPMHQPQTQYAYYPPSYPTHMPHGQTNSSSAAPQYSKWYNGAPQQGTHDQGPPSYAPNYPQQPPAGYNPNPLVSHMHTSSTPNFLGSYGSATNVSSDPGRNYSQAPPVGYPQQMQNGENGQKNNESTPHHHLASANSAPQQGTHDQGPPSYAPNYPQQPPAGYNPNPRVSHMHTSSTPNLLGSYGSATNVSSDPGRNYSQAPPVGYPQQMQNGENGQKNNESTPHHHLASANSAPNYCEAPPPSGYPPQQSYNQQYYGAQNPSYQQPPPTGSAHHGHSQSEPSLGVPAYSGQQSYFPATYLANEQKPHGEISYGPPPVQYQQYSHAAPGSYSPRAPPQMQAEA